MKKFLRTLMPAKVIQSRLHQRVFQQFADKIGLVYFGYVNQRSDEHRPVRGLTMSARHVDNHYCIGSFGGYEVTLVERTDTLTFPGKPAKHHTWVIMTFNLHIAVDLPHVFVGLHAHSETFYAHLFTKFSGLHKIDLGMFGIHDQAFTDRYAIFAQPAKSIEVQQLFDPSVTKVIADHFGSLTIEIADNQLYVYAQQPPTQAVLETMIKYGAWLAETIERRAA
jgi:hypothetical protein